MPAPIAVDANLGTVPRTQLVINPGTREVLTANREMDTRSALARGLVEYIQNKSIEMPGGRKLTLKNVYTTIPDAEQKAVYPAATAVPEGPGEYIAVRLTPSINPKDRIKMPDGRWPFAWAEFRQDIRLELIANDPKEREGLTAMLEDLFMPVDWMTGFRLILPHYYSAVAHYEPLRMGYADGADTAIERLRVTYFYIRAHVSAIKLLTKPVIQPFANTTVDGLP